MLKVNDRVSVPLSEFRFEFSRSGGPGGQNVNKVHSRAVLRWNVAASPTVRAGDLAHLPDCESLGIEGSGADGCLRIESEDMSGDYASFWAIVSYTYLD